MTHYLEFEKHLAEIEGKAEELRALARQNEGMDVEKEAAALDRKAATMLRDLYKNLTPWQRMQVARHPERPHCRDYVEQLFTDFTPLAGDRAFADDHAVMGGLARLEDQPVVVIGQEKGHDTKTRIQRNFGMARPEGYRKAIRLMDLAHRFGLPLITLVDTPGAYPGKGAEERGQSEAIARSTQKCLQVGVPLVSVVIGEGGSGGAVAFATADRVIDARELDLLGDQPRGLRLDPLEGCREDARGRRGAAADGAGPAPARRHRRGGAGTERRRAPRPPQGDRGGRRGDPQGAVGAGRDAVRCAGAGPTRQVPADGRQGACRVMSDAARIPQPARIAVFDVGNVLIEWDPQRRYDAAIGPERRARLFAEVDLEAMNRRIDLGHDIAAVVEETAARHPEWAGEIRDWHRAWLELIGPELPGPVALLREVKEQGHPVWALTNFGDDTFELARRHFPVLGAFDGAIVSGRLGVAKPCPAIYVALEAATGAEGEAIFFVDDREENVAAATARGWRAHQYRDPEALAAALAAAGLIERATSSRAAGA